MQMSRRIAVVLGATVILAGNGTGVSVATPAGTSHDGAVHDSRVVARSQAVSDSYGPGNCHRDGH